ncbi:MAG: hypothetical protein RMK97_07510 [Sutterellaceae bacterium]|nr:hypothetical protein [Burkholderiaceae bacterium]MCX7902045.1 hypothetical protein [Burkholderiaceae bacterium]MDW8430332.1 hypothetical protein [Sutterellaceae bacterium]
MQQLEPDLADRLSGFTIELYGDGQLRERGGGANVLGSPLMAVAHLLAVLAQSPVPAPLAAGELVTTGTLTRARPVAAGQAWHTVLAGIELPGVAVHFVCGVSAPGSAPPAAPSTLPPAATARR